MKHPFIYIILLLTLCQASPGQLLSPRIRFTNYTVADGLPVNSVNDIMQDSRGFIWLSTSQGLARFNGNEFITFTHRRKDSSSMPVENVNRCMELKNNELLISSGQMMWMLNTINHRQHPPPAFWKEKTQALPFMQARNLLAIKSETKIYFTDSNLRVLDSIADPVAAISRIVYLGDQLFLLSNGQRSFCYSLKNKKLAEWNIPLNIFLPEHGYEIRQADTIQKEIYIMSYRSGVFKMSYDKTKTNYLVPEKLKGYNNFGAVKNILRHNHTFIISTEWGLSILQDGQSQVNSSHIEGDNNSLPAGKQGFIFSDKEDNYWVSGENGISRFNLQQLNYDSWHLPYSFPASIQHFTKYDDKIWMSSETAGSLYLDLVTKQLHVVDSSILTYCWGVLPVNNEIYIHGNSDHIKYQTTLNTKLLKYDIQSKKITSLSVLKSFYDNTELITMICHSHDGDTWYSLNNGGGIIRQHGDRFVQYSRKSTGGAFNVSYVNKAAEDKNGNMYFSVNYYNKILVWKNKEQHFISWDPDSLLHRHFILNNAVLNHIIDARQNLWLSVIQTGLVRYNLITGEGKFYTTEDGLLDNSFDNMVTDAAGNLWIPTAKGLDCLLSATDKFVSFTETDGLPVSNFYDSYLFFDSAGSSLYFSKPGFLYRINSDELLQRRKKCTATLFIDKMEMNGRPYFFTNDSDMQLRPNENNLQFTFTLLDLDNKVSDGNYEYLLTRNNEGQWQKLGTTGNIALRNMKPGSYTLQARIFNDVTGSFITSENMLHFTIATAWYNKLWFKLLMAAAFLVIIFFMIRAYFLGKLRKQQRLLEKERTLTEERNRIATDMHDDVGAGLSRIRYITSSLQPDKEISDADKTRIISLSDDAVEKMNEIIWALNQGNQQLEQLIYYTRSQAGEMVNNAGLEFTFESPENIPVLTLGWKDCRDIYLLVKESVNNAIKHASAKRITVIFKITHLLHITVKDDGKGFDESKIRKEGNEL